MLKYYAGFVLENLCRNGTCLVTFETFYLGRLWRIAARRQTLTKNRFHVNKIPMKKIKFIAATALAIAFLSGSLIARADGTNSVSPAIPTTPPPVPDLLTTCPVSGEKLGSMGAPVVFVYQGQEVKLCCPSCKPDFDKDPAKYMKLIRAADKPQK
jgi:YHS domain-containing protein